MREIFQYTHSEDADFNAVVDSCISSARAKFEGKKVENYAEQVRLLDEAMAEYIVKGTKYEAMYEAKGLEVFKNPQVTHSTSIRENFDLVLAQVVNAIAPEVTSARYASAFAEVIQVGYGDTARFVVKSNALFKVNQKANGVQRGVLQPIYDKEYTVDCSPIEIATSINWYQLAAGVLDFGDFTLKIGRSFEAYIFLKIIAAMSSATVTAAAYTASGTDAANWTTLAQKVSAANGGAPVYALGTLTTFSQTIPSTVGLQYGLGDKIMRDGALDRYYGVDLVPVDNVINPMTINTTGDLVIPDDTIFMIAADAYKPVKVVFEGDSITVTGDPNQEGNADRTYNISVTMRLGVSAIVGSKFGIIDLGD